MEPRLATSVLVSALMRRTESEGGFATVLSKGDPTSGSILLILAEKGRNARVLERALGPAGRYIWRVALSEAAENKEDFEKFLQRRRRIDPDLWVLELDIASAERFTAELAAFD